MNTWSNRCSSAIITALGARDAGHAAALNSPGSRRFRCYSGTSFHASSVHDMGREAVELILLDSVCSERIFILLSSDTAQPLWPCADSALMPQARTTHVRRKPRKLRPDKLAEHKSRRIYYASCDNHSRAIRRARRGHFHMDTDISTTINTLSSIYRIGKSILDPLGLSYSVYRSTVDGLPIKDVFSISCRPCPSTVTTVTSFPPICVGSTILSTALQRTLRRIGGIRVRPLCTTPVFVSYSGQRPTYTAHAASAAHTMIGNIGTFLSAFFFHPLIYIKNSNPICISISSRYISLSQVISNLGTLVEIQSNIFASKQRSSLAHTEASSGAMLSESRGSCQDRSSVSQYKDKNAMGTVDPDKQVAENVGVKICWPDMTPLHRAAVSGNLVEALKNLQYAGQQVAGGYTALHLAILKGWPELVAALFPHEGHILTNLFQTPLDVLYSVQQSVYSRDVSSPTHENNDVQPYPADEIRELLSNYGGQKCQKRTVSEVFQADTISSDTSGRLQFLLDQSPSVFLDAHANSTNTPLDGVVNTFLQQMSSDMALHSSLVVISEANRVHVPDKVALKAIDMLLSYTHDENYIINDLRSILTRILAEHWWDLLESVYTTDYCNALRGIPPSDTGHGGDGNPFNLQNQAVAQTKQDPWTPWFRYAEQGNILGMKRLISTCSGSHLSVFVSVMNFGPWFPTALMLSVITRNKTLFDLVVDTEMGLQDGCLKYTALMIAVLLGWDYAVYTLANPKLVTAGPDGAPARPRLLPGEKKIQGIMGKTALACAVETNRLGYAEALLDEAGLTDGLGTPAVVYAMRPERLDLFKLLLPLERHCRDSVGNTVLKYAEKIQNKIFKQLVLKDLHTNG